MNLSRCIFVFSLFAVQLLCTACVRLPISSSYAGPPERPVDLLEYYAVGESYNTFEVETSAKNKHYQLKRITAETMYGQITIDYFDTGDKSDDLIFVFPVLGGKYIFSKYFADYYARKGFSTAIVHRDKEFRRADNYERIEEVFRRNVIRDRIAMDLFEQEFDKKDFASFGMSRGAINAAVTAGVDERLRFNVLALGGADIVSLFKDSEEKGIRKYRKEVIASRSISEQQFYRFLNRTLKTDPKWLAWHIDARDTLMFLSVFDESVPLKYGLKLRRTIGNPKTIFLLSGHYSSVAYTQFVKLVPPTRDFCIFPLDYVETESLAFYQEAFGREEGSFKRAVFRFLQAPVQFVAEVVRLFSF